ncbi:phosphoglycerate mutase-like protein [Gymnopus androsaceus JB14]|uniref:Phosphoglycerate mutase-like protein n=1 Tax=Gymnopus androsaceus JB14 TaxID=1447944 RepID=A0A6A4H8P5_9AGAR|nr:phosphoglycerate mutase-like protein [Gymnopus androsaceus JB14]
MDNSSISLPIDSEGAAPLQLPSQEAQADLKPWRCLVISLVRHGQAQSNTDLVWRAGPDSPLTYKGRIQAQRLGEAWANVRIDRLLSSHLIRAVDTAQAISDNNKHRPVVIQQVNLQERKTGSVVESLRRQGRDDEASIELRGWGEDDTIDRHHTPGGGGESLETVAERAKLFIFSCMAKYGVDTLENPEEFDVGRWESTPEDLPEGLPHVVVVSHNIFLCELYEMILYWHRQVRGPMICDLANTGWYV